jgi:A/G-specific adenine glycosylase
MPPRKPVAPAPQVPADAAVAFRRKLHRWFREHSRDLPWRRTRDPYRILISELMLQQTQVSRVLDFYRRFLERFPDLHALAKAKPQRVLEAWEGLGYYARARNLHKLAKHVTEARDGIIPSEPEELRALPGVGAYTAGAVASFAYEKRAALVDTNVARVLHRVFAPDLDPTSGAGLKRLWQIAEQLLPRTGKVVWTHNQALMELGALVCSARSPKCGTCPVHRVCASRDRFMASDPVVPLTKKRTRRVVKPE